MNKIEIPGYSTESGPTSVTITERQFDVVVKDIYDLLYSFRRDNRGMSPSFVSLPVREFFMIQAYSQYMAYEKTCNPRATEYNTAGKLFGISLLASNSSAMSCIVSQGDVKSLVFKGIK